MICMTATAAIVSLTGFQTVSLQQYLVNLTMMPQLLGVDFIDGVYWTLLLEIVFYGIVFIAIATNIIRFPRILLSTSVFILVLLYSLGYRIPLFGGYAFLFAAGCSLALIYQGDRRSIPVFILAAVFSMMFAFSEAQEKAVTLPGIQPWIASFVVGIFYLSFFWFRARDVASHQGGRILGSLTYPLYLIHAHVGFSILSAWQGEDNKWWLTALTIVAMLGISLFVATRIESLKIWGSLANRFLARPIDGQVKSFAARWTRPRVSDRGAACVHKEGSSGLMGNGGESAQDASMNLKA
jgi:peptidoglycan/LPS O-acetylase OafA/YrhL